MAKPSYEAAEAAARVLYDGTARRKYTFDEAEGAAGIWRALALQSLQAALPIERNRWEQEVRERLLSDEVIEQISNQIWVDPVRTALDMALDSIFGEAEPVEGENGG